MFLSPVWINLLLHSLIYQFKTAPGLHCTWCRVTEPSVRLGVVVFSSAPIIYITSVLDGTIVREKAIYIFTKNCFLRITRRKTFFCNIL